MAKKNIAPMASTKAGHGCRGVTGSGGSLCNPRDAAQQQQPATSKSLWCSGEQNTSGAAVLGRYACTPSSRVWIHMAYLHRHAGFSILPFIRGSPTLALPASPGRSPSCCQQGCEQLPLWPCAPPARPVFSEINHCCSDSTRGSHPEEGS